MDKRVYYDHFDEFFKKLLGKEEKKEKPNELLQLEQVINSIIEKE